LTINFEETNIETTLIANSYSFPLEQKITIPYLKKKDYNIVNADPVGSLSQCFTVRGRMVVYHIDDSFTGAIAVSLIRFH
jgi:hypothetical protein